MKKIKQKYYPTRKQALKALKKKVKETKKKLKSEGEKVLGDNSFVYSAELFNKPETNIIPDGTELTSRKGTGEHVWYTCVSLMTQRLMDDLLNPESPIYIYRDVVTELEDLISKEIKLEINKR